MKTRKQDRQDRQELIEDIWIVGGGCACGIIVLVIFLSIFLGS